MILYKNMSYTVKELKQMCKDKGIKGYSNYNKSELEKCLKNNRKTPKKSPKKTLKPKSVKPKRKCKTNSDCNNPLFPVCCDEYTKGHGTCRPTRKHCFQESDKTKRERDISTKELKKLREKMGREGNIKISQYGLDKLMDKSEKKEQIHKVYLDLLKLYKKKNKTKKDFTEVYRLSDILRNHLYFMKKSINQSLYEKLLDKISSMKKPLKKYNMYADLLKKPIKRKSRK